MRKKITFAAGVLFVLVSGILILRQMNMYLKVPNQNNWMPVYQTVRGNWQQGDQLCFVPDWLAGYATDGRLFEDLTRVKKSEIYDRKVVYSGRLWIIECFNSFNEKRALRKGFVKVNEYNLDRVKVTLYQVPQAGVKYDFKQNISSASAVNLSSVAGEISATENMGGWFFRQANAVPVFVSQKPFQTVSRRGILFCPEEKWVKSMSFENVPSGKEIHLFGGIDDDNLYRNVFEPVYLLVNVDGRDMGEFSFDNRMGWFHHVVQLEGQKEPMKVTFSVYSQKSNVGDWRRNFYFDAYLI